MARTWREEPGWIKLLLLAIIVATLFFICLDFASAATTEYTASSKTVCDDHGVCNKELYSGVMYAQNSAGDWVNSEDVMGISRYQDDITFWYDGIGGYKDITFETGVIYDGGYYSFSQVVQAAPELIFDFPVEHLRGTKKYSVIINNIDQTSLTPGLFESITLTYKNHTGFELSQLRSSRGKYLIGEVLSMGFSDALAMGYNYSINVPERRIYIENLSAGYNNGTINIDPTLTLQDAGTENMVDFWSRNDTEGTRIQYISFIKFNGSSLLNSSIDISEARLYMYFYGVSYYANNDVYVMGTYDGTWNTSADLIGMAIVNRTLDDETFRNDDSWMYVNVTTLAIMYQNASYINWSIFVDQMDGEGNLSSNTSNLLFFEGHYHDNADSGSLRMGDGGRAHSKEYANSSLHPYLWIQFNYTDRANIESSTISPTTANTTITLRGYCNASHPLGTNITYYYKWWNGTTLYSTGNTSPNNYTPGTQINVANITSSLTAKGETWIISCDAYDGTFYSQALNSTGITIINALPTAPTSISTPSSVELLTTITAICAGGGDDDSDTIDYVYRFYNINDTTIVQNYSSSTTYTTQSNDLYDTINITCKSFDGTGYSINNISNTTTVNPISSGGGGGGGGGLTIVDPSCSLDILEPPEGQLTSLCPANKTFSLSLNIANPDSTDATFSFSYVDITCSPTNDVFIPGGTSRRINIDDCECPSSGNRTEASITIYNEDKECIAGVIPLVAIGNDYVRIIWMVLIGLLILVLLIGIWRWTNNR